MKKTLLVLFGGQSGEHEVSLSSAAAVCSGIDQTRYKLVMVGITKDGEWRAFYGHTDQIKDGTWSNPECSRPICWDVSGRDKFLYIYTKDGRRSMAVDAILPILHGKPGEDGSIQALAELAGIPLIGCDMTASALCMDKDKSHRIVATAGIRVPKSVVVYSPEGASRIAELACLVGYPIIVKPLGGGSSQGISVVKGSKDIIPAIMAALEYDHAVIAEEMIEGFEVGCAVRGRNKIRVSEVDEIELHSDYFDFDEKYHRKKAKIHLPARISPEIKEMVQETAAKVYRALGCRDFARVDMFVTREGDIVFNEVNTIPGFTEFSRFPAMAMYQGMTFKELITCIIEEVIGGDEEVFDRTEKDETCLESFS